MIICPNCGAKIEEDVEKCPFCGYINIEGAKKKHQENIEEIKEDIEEVRKEPEKAFKRGMSKGVKIILWTVGTLLVLVGIYAVILMFALRNEPKMHLSPEEQAFASAYKLVAKDQLEEAYNNGDIAEMARIFDKARSEDRVDLWGDPHYETAYAATRYMKLKETLPSLDGKKLKKKEAEEITYDCFYFYYKAYGEDGEPLFASIRENEIIPIIHDRLGFTDEDMEKFRTMVTVPTGVVRSNVYSKTKSYFKNYR